MEKAYIILGPVFFKQFVRYGLKSAKHKFIEIENYFENLI